jgi:ABC-type multidrug transport system ATPase subunit
VSRLGKDVVDLIDASAGYDGRTVLHETEWRIAPGERTGILGANGAGKSTLLGLISGNIKPSAGRVKRGKTVRIATLSQKTDELDDYLEMPVHAVLAELHTTYTFGTGSKAKELTPAQLLEQLGFAAQQLATPVRDLSGGQKRRVQLLLILLAAPNVLILDEPTNDLDTDMLAALEDLLDSWPGTLLVVSHDRYFLERVTDQQYAVLDGRLRHLPGGVDEYLRLQAGPAESRREEAQRSTGRSAAPASAGPDGTQALTGADLRAADKELASLERRIERLQRQAADARANLAGLDQSDYQRLATEMSKITTMEDEASSLEERWLEISARME